MPKKFSTESNNGVYCVIVGSGDFLGCELARQMLSQGCRVVIVDDTSGKTNNNLQQLKENSNLSVLSTSNKDLEILFSTKPDYIFYLELIDLYEHRDPKYIYQETYRKLGFERYMSWCQKAEAKLLLGCIESLYEENASLVKGKDVGDKTERYWEIQEKFESLVFAYSKAHALDVRIVRITEPSGAGMSIASSNPITKCYISAVKQGCVEVVGDGNQLLYPTHISDIAFGMIKAMFSQSSNGKMYALVNKEGLSLFNLVKFIEQALGKSIRIVNTFEKEITEKQGLTQAMLLSQEVLGWFPRCNINTILQNTFEWLGKSVSVDHQYQQPTTQTVAETLSINNLPIKHKASQATEDGYDSKNSDSFDRINVHRLQDEEGKFDNPKKSQPNTELLINKNSKNKLPVFTIQPPVQITSPFSNVIGRLPGFTGIAHTSTRYVIFGFVMILLLFILPQLLFITGSKIARNHNIAITNSLLKSTSIKPDYWTDSMLVMTAGKILPWVEWQHALFGVDTTQQAEALLVYKDLLGVVSDANQLFLHTEKVVDAIFGRDSVNMVNTLDQAKQNTLSLSEKLAFLEARYKKNELQDMLGSDIGLLREWNVNWGESLVLLSTSMLSEQRKIIAIAIQDSLELRPTGGYMDSIMFLTIEKGKLLDVQVKSVDELDASLQGVVQPPDDIAPVINGRLGEKQWWLRDANMYANFYGKSAPRIAWFIEKETGIKVSAVIAVDSYYFKDILHLLGGVFIPELNETITADNTLERLFSHATSAIGSNGNKQTSFLQLLSIRLVEKIKSMPSDQVIGILPVISEQARKRHIMVYDESFIDDGHQLWKGEVPKTMSQVVEFGDLHMPGFIMPIEANVGINKSNYHIQRNLAANVKLGNTGSSDIQVKYELNNMSQTEMWPSGSYKSMVWLYLSQNANIKKVGVTNDNFEYIELKSTEIEIVEEGDKKRVGFYIEVPPLSKRTIQIEYGMEGSQKDIKNVSMFIAKQSGVGVMPVQLVIEYPPLWRPEKITHQTETGSGSLKLVKDIETDLFFAVSFSR